MVAVGAKFKHTSERCHRRTMTRESQIKYHTMQYNDIRYNHIDSDAALRTQSRCHPPLLPLQPNPRHRETTQGTQNEHRITRKSTIRDDDLDADDAPRSRTSYHPSPVLQSELPARLEDNDKHASKSQGDCFPSHARPRLVNLVFPTSHAYAPPPHARANDGAEHASKSQGDLFPSYICPRFAGPAFPTPFAYALPPAPPSSLPSHSHCDTLSGLKLVLIILFSHYLFLSTLYIFFHNLSKNSPSKAPISCVSVRARTLEFKSQGGVQPQGHLRAYTIDLHLLRDYLHNPQDSPNWSHLSAFPVHLSPTYWVSSEANSHQESIRIICFLIQPLPILSRPLLSTVSQISLFPPLPFTPKAF